MKALSIKQPWASLIAHGVKDIENRTWATKKRERVFIHSSAKFAGDINTLFSDDQWHAMGEEMRCNMVMKNFVFSAIIGEVDIIDCVINHDSIWAEHKLKGRQCPECGCTEYVNKNLVGDGYRMCKQCHQDWWIDIAYGKPIYNWVLVNPVLYDEPILNVKGKLSFWEFNK